jgi:hypothetical protein
MSIPELSATFGALRRVGPSRPVPRLIQIAGHRPSICVTAVCLRDPMVMKQARAQGSWGPAAAN